MQRVAEILLARNLPYIFVSFCQTFDLQLFLQPAYIRDSKY